MVFNEAQGIFTHGTNQLKEAAASIADEIKT